jgi:hypothetical protein
MSTAAQIYELGYAKSRKNQPTITDEASDGLAFVNRTVRAMFAVAARVNPLYFGKYTDVAFASGGWARPAAAESIFFLEHAGDEVAVVPMWDKAAETSMKAVYRLGAAFTPAGNVNDPTSGSLRFYYADSSVDAALITDPIDARWPTRFDELLALEVAIYLAVRDGREEERPGLVDQRDFWLRLFIAHLEHETVNERRRFNLRPRALATSVLPLGSLLAGGTTVQLPGG